MDKILSRKSKLRLILFFLLPISCITSKSPCPHSSVSSNCSKSQDLIFYECTKLTNEWSYTLEANDFKFYEARLYIIPNSIAMLELNQKSQLGVLTRHPVSKFLPMVCLNNNNHPKIYSYGYYQYKEYKIHLLLVETKSKENLGVEQFMVGIFEKSQKVYNSSILAYKRLTEYDSYLINNQYFVEKGDLVIDLWDFYKGDGYGPGNLLQSPCVCEIRLINKQEKPPAAARLHRVCHVVRS